MSRIVDGLVILAVCTLSIMVQIFNGEGDISSYRLYRAVMLLENRMKVVETVL